VLVVGEHSYDVRGAADSLLYSGYAVLVQPDSFEALRVCGLPQARFDVLVTCATGSELSKVELAARALALRPELRLLVLANPSEAEAGAGSELAAALADLRCTYSILPRPIVARDLREALEELLSRQPVSASDSGAGGNADGIPSGAPVRPLAVDVAA
jgi:hypothetical protein